MAYSTNIITVTKDNVYAKRDAISNKLKNSFNLNPIPLLLPRSSTTSTIFQIREIPPLAAAIINGYSWGRKKFINFFL